VYNLSQAGYGRLNQFGVGLYLHLLVPGANRKMNRNGGSFVDVERDAFLEIFLEPGCGDFQPVMPNRQLQ